MKYRALFFACLALPALAAEPDKPAGTLIDFHVEVQKSIPNDLGRAIAYAETTGADPAEVARKVKSAIAEGFALAKSQPGIVAKSGSTQTWPIYGKTSRSIESWRMHSEILLESRDAAALSAAIDKLQTTLVVGGIQFAPAPETRRKAEEEASIEAIEAFRTQAARIAAAMNKSFHIRQMNLDGNRPAPSGPFRAAAMMAESTPMPVEAGQSSITIQVAGQIELRE